MSASRRSFSAFYFSPAVFFLSSVIDSRTFLIYSNSIYLWVSTALPVIIDQSERYTSIKFLIITKTKPPDVVFQFGKGVYIADQVRTRWRHVTSRPKKTVQEEEDFQILPLRRGFSTPEGLVRLQEKYPLHKPAQEERLIVQLSANQRNDSFSGLSSLESSPKRSSRFRSYSLSVKDARSRVNFLISKEFILKVIKFYLILG